MALFFSNNPKVAEKCRISPSCPYKEHLDKSVCWGYEKGCKEIDSYSRPSCPEDHRGWVRTKEEQVETFYNQGDFGYIQEHIDQMAAYCEPQKKGDSSLQCSDSLRFCHGINIYIDFRDLSERKEPIRYSMDVLKDGQIGGRCKLNKELLLKNCDQISPLQSWGPELRNFQELTESVKKGPMCDVWVEHPTYIMKIDATVNMYHHFCDFFNLYASQHVNSTGEAAFSVDNQIVIWESYPYYSNFGVMWKVFSKRQPWTLSDLAGKRVCFKNVIFPLLPRMIFGLYYNTPLIWGCEKSGLFHAFSKHVVHRLNIPTRIIGDGKIHITILSRKTKHRRILNEGKLIKALKRNKEFLIRKVEFGHDMDFKEQLKQDQWTDILIGVHGAGLTHLLFLPDWAVIFEIYNCGDPNCYKDLARLRGINYITWENEKKVVAEDEGHHPKLGAHEKFTSYEFDVKEFLRLVQQAVTLVKNHRAWQNIQEKLKTRHDEL
ncbi:EGF-domain O-GlcNAc transferase isoform X2 [Oratosquilla oratoria]